MDRRDFLKKAGWVGGITTAGFMGMSVPAFASGGKVAAAKMNTVANGNWSNPAIWSLGRIPAATDSITIKHNVTFDTSSTINRLQINANKSLTFSPVLTVTLTSKGNVVVDGTLTMVPNSASVVHKLVFINIDENDFVGGGDVPLNSDVGLWVVGAGRLVAKGTPKVAWNRTGDDASWAATDELVVTPIGFGDSIKDDAPFASFAKGSQVPSVTFVQGTADEATHFAEVLNLTRNVRIEGTATGRTHIFISSSAASDLSYLQIRYFGPRHGVGQGSDFVLGRYGLHLHHNDNSQSGQTFEGLVQRDGGSHAYVAHNTNGLTFKDCISYNTMEDAYWWDMPDNPYPNPPNNHSDNITYDHCVAALVRSDPVYEGYRLAGFHLAAGEPFSNTIKNCVAVGVQGNSDAAGFVWPEINTGSGVWVFEDNLAHNCSAFGATVWQVNNEDHIVTRFTAYHNGKAGVFNGAYANPYKWDGLLLYANGGSSDDFATGPHTQFFDWTSNRVVGDVITGRPWQLINSKMFAEGRTASCLIVAGRAVVSGKLADGVTDQPLGQYNNNKFRGYTEEAVLFTFKFHDFGPYKTRFSMTGNDYGPGNPFWFDEGGLGNHIDSILVVDGVGTLHKASYPSGVLHPEWNAKVT